MEIKERYNERLERWAVKFHGLKKGSTVSVKGWGIGKVVDYNFKCNFPYVYVDVRGFNSQYNADNVALLSNL